jgi:lysophospholipase L1-like esterase
MTTYDVYSKTGADNRFAPKADVNALTSAQIAQGAEIGTLKEQVRAQLVLANMLPRLGGPSAPSTVVVGFIGDSWSTPGAGGQGGAPEEATMPQIAAKRLGVGAAVSGQGSTGWAHVPTPTPQGDTGFFSAPKRVDAVLDAHPSLLVVVGSVNDNWAIDQPPVPSDPASGPKAISQSVKALVDRVRTRAPALPIIVVGPQPTSEYRTYSGSSHKNVHAVKDGVDLAGGLTNGIWFSDWLGVATSPATRWDPASSPNRHWVRGEIICHEGVNYEVVADAWVPSANPDAADPYLASFLPSAPVSRRTAVLSGRGAVGKTPASGTRALWLMSDETHVNVAGAQAFGVELADRVIEGVQALREWIISKGPVVVRPAPAPGPGPQPAGRPCGAAADVRDARWGVKWGALSASALQAALAQLPEGGGAALRGSAALPVRMSKDEGADRFVTSTVSSITPKGGGAAVRINQSTVPQLKAVEDVNGTVATLGEALDILDAAPARTPIIVECMDTSNDIIADYWVYDRKMMEFLLARYGANAAKRVIVATNGTLNAARAKAKADAALKVLPRLAYKPSGPWTAEDIGALKAVDMIACRSNDTSKPEVLTAIKNHPEKPGLWWAGMTTAAHVEAAKTASKAAGLAIEGWIMEAKEAAPGALSTALPVRP